MASDQEIIGLLEVYDNLRDIKDRVGFMSASMIFTSGQSEYNRDELRGAGFALRDVHDQMQTLEDNIDRCLKAVAPTPAAA